MEGPETWRELLAEIISDSQERERIVQELDVNRITVARWINKETMPRLDSLRRLLDAVPEQRKRLFDLLIRVALLCIRQSDPPTANLSNTHTPRIRPVGESLRHSNSFIPAEATPIPSVQA